MAPEASEGTVPAVFRYRQVLTWACAISFVSILLTSWAWSRESRLLAVTVLLPLLLPYAFIPLRLYSGAQERFESRYCNGRRLFVPGIMLVRFALTWDRRWWVVGSLLLASSMQFWPLSSLLVRHTFPCRVCGMPTEVSG